MMNSLQEKVCWLVRSSCREAGLAGALALQEILGERACVVRKLSKVQLKCGPRSAARQQFLVRGSFLVDVEDGDEEEDDTPEPNTFWVHQADLLETISVDDVEEALEARQEAVMSGLRPAKKARK